MRKKLSIKDKEKKRKSKLTADDMKLGLLALLAEVQKPKNEQDNDIWKKIKRSWDNKINGSGSNSIH